MFPPQARKLAVLLAVYIYTAVATEAYANNDCLDPDSATPPALRFGYPAWASSANNPNCAPRYTVGSDGECFRPLSPENDCAAFCQQHSGWFYGQPIDTMQGAWCERGEDCTRGYSFSVNNGTTYSVSIGETDGRAKPSWAAEYCGAWFVVPIIGLTCGRGASGTLTRASDGTTHCALDPATASFQHCFNYTFWDPTAPSSKSTKHKLIFVLKDCEKGYILPGEWQNKAFAESFDPETYLNSHVARFGWASSKEQIDGEGYTPRGSNAKFTKTIGPEDHNLEVCGRGKYCVRHKLPDGHCHNFLRGFAGSKPVHLVSAKTTPGNCCVLFSRHECYGLPQVVKGDIPNLGAVGYLGQPHSVVCNVAEYCDPNRMDRLIPTQ
ncbi:hypothetical protein B0H63DRAFT_455602 [Podospora didyma]|uniref:Secreted protein n=1 Tax=Podospora didyma TaxID=330526 RepID=A0AAE0JZZ6_9PEZI|nr:hypothetical protein B0H63DRAFT_455602 [Podospora didyma]